MNTEEEKEIYVFSSPETFIKGKRPPHTLLIPNTDIILTKEGLEKTIRYLPGEDKLFASEQSDFADRKKPVKIRIKNGTLMVSKYDKNLLEFLKTCNYNGSNPNRKPNAKILFYESKPDQKASESVDTDRLSTEVRHKIHNMQPDELGMYARELRVPNVFNKTLDELKHYLLNAVKKNMRIFENATHNLTEKTREYVIAKAIHEGELYNDSRTLKFKDGDVYCTAPIDQNSLMYAAQYSASEEGRAKYKKLKEVMFGGGIGSKFIQDEEDAYQNNIAFKQNKDLVKVLAEEGIIVSLRGKMYFRRDGENEYLGRSIDDCAKNLIEDEVSLRYLKKLVPKPELEKTEDEEGV